jgi:hypothetical protein
VLAGLELTLIAPFDEQEKTRVGRRARPPMLLQLVRRAQSVQTGALRGGRSSLGPPQA